MASRIRNRFGAGRTAGVIVSAMAGLVLGIVAYVVLLMPGPIRGDLDLVRSSRPGLRVLFVGNSFTSRNSMITMVRKLGEGDPGARPIFAVEYVPGGSTLVNATHDERLTKLLTHETWNDVVLQEQSEIPSLPGVREKWMWPAATWFDTVAKRIGARTILFETWGYKQGDRRALPADTYQSMQARLEEGYWTLAARLPGALLAPVGRAWAQALASRPNLDLWSSDGRHPSREGSYLAACVFYALLTQRDPSRSRFTAGLRPAEAELLQRIAARSVRRTMLLVAHLARRSPARRIRSTQVDRGMPSHPVLTFRPRWVTRRQRGGLQAAPFAVGAAH